MTGVRAWLFALAVGVGASPAVGAPLEAYGKLPTIEAAAVSPSGSEIAYVTTNGEERTVSVQQTGTNKLLMIAKAGASKVRGIYWAGDQHLLVMASVTANTIDVIAPKSEWHMLIDLDVQTHKVRQLMQDADDGMNTVFSGPMVRLVDGKPAVFVIGMHFVDGYGCYSLFQINLDSGRSRLVASGNRETREWVVDVDGHVLAQEAYDDSSGRWSLRMNAHPGWRDSRVVSAPIDTPDVEGLGRDGHSVLVANADEEHLSWNEVSSAGDWGQATALEGARAAIHQPMDGRLIGYHVLVGDEDRYTFFDPNDQKIWNAIRKASPDDGMSLVSWSSDHRKVLVLADSPVNGPAYGFVDLDSRQLRWLGAQYMGLKAQDISPVRPVGYKAKDGLELGGYLTLPRGREPKSLPLIVFPHGGPAARDTAGFDWWAQAMASRGYAVLQVNFRGSDGLGGDLLEAGFGQWGRKMQTDLSDGVRYLAGQGIIDPKRVCIVGGSYGGYAALAGPTLDRGVYRCAVSFGGISDLKRMVGWSRTRHGHEAFRYWTRFMGAEDLKDPVLVKYSPALHAADADAPILLIHGKDDTVVPLEQSTEMAGALKAAGKPVELIVQNHADHWLSLGDTRLQMLQATMTFVERNNPPN